jgi:hypothetical protein
MHLLVLGRGNETSGRFRLVDRPIAMDLGAARLRLGLKQLGMQHGRRGAHALAPLRIWAI